MIKVLFAQVPAAPASGDPPAWLGYVCCGLGVLFVFWLVGKLMGPSRCEECGTPIKRKYYTYKVGGKKLRVCPNCSRAYDREISRKAVNKRLRR